MKWMYRVRTQSILTWSLSSWSCLERDSTRPLVLSRLVLRSRNSFWSFSASSEHSDMARIRGNQSSFLFWGGDTFNLCFYILRNLTVKSKSNLTDFRFVYKTSFMSGSYLDHFIDVAFRARKLGRIFNFYEDNEVEVVPQIVFHSEMLLERNCLVVEGSSLQTEECNAWWTSHAEDAGFTNL